MKYLEDVLIAPLISENVLLISLSLHQRQWTLS